MHFISLFYNSSKVNLNFTSKDHVVQWNNLSLRVFFIFNKIWLLVFIKLKIDIYDLSKMVDMDCMVVIDVNHKKL